jgi:hypothetical protein
MIQAKPVLKYRFSNARAVLISIGYLQAPSSQELHHAFDVIRSRREQNVTARR